MPVGSATVVRSRPGNEAGHLHARSALCAVLCAALGCTSENKPAAPAPRSATQPVGSGSSAAGPGSNDLGGKPAGESYDAALSRGRELVKTKQYKGAIAAFQAALVATPGDARAQSELGWAAFRAGDLDLAQDATRKSIDAASDPKVKAASLYNLGRILEARGDAKAAGDAYRESLQLRPNRVVDSRLAALGAGGTAETLDPRPLQGPSRLPAGVEPRDLEGPTKLATPAAPFEAVEVRTQGDADYSAAQLAIKTHAGWFVSEEFLQQSAAQMWGSIKELTVDRGVLKVVYTQGWVGRDFDDENGSYAIESDSTLVVVCGVGRSGKPSCTPPVTMSTTSVGLKDVQWSRKVTLLADRVLKVEGKRGDPHVGAHKLVFP
jgi:hypothetical protein